MQPQRSISMAVNSSFNVFKIFILMQQNVSYTLAFMSICVNIRSLNHVKHLNILYVLFHKSPSCKYVCKRSFTKKKRCGMSFVPFTHSYKSRVIIVPLPVWSIWEILRYYTAGSLQTFEARGSGVILDQYWWRSALLITLSQRGID